MCYLVYVWVRFAYGDDRDRGSGAGLPSARVGPRARGTVRKAGCRMSSLGRLLVGRVMRV